jgi:hypothetical protein
VITNVLSELCEKFEIPKWWSEAVNQNDRHNRQDEKTNNNSPSTTQKAND